MTYEPKTLAAQCDSRQRLDFDGKLFVSAEYWWAEFVDRQFAQAKHEKPKAQEQKPVFGKRAA